VAFIRPWRARRVAIDAIEVARRMIVDYDRVVDEFDPDGIELDIARSIAGIAV